MSYQSTLDALRDYSNFDDPSLGFSNFIESDPDHLGFSSVTLPSGYLDYIREIDGVIFVITDGDQDLKDIDRTNGWIFAVYSTIEDYINSEFDGSGQAVIADYGYDTFDDCFKAAAVDYAQHLGWFKYR